MGTPGHCIATLHGSEMSVSRDLRSGYCVSAVTVSAEFTGGLCLEHFIWNEYCRDSDMSSVSASDSVSMETGISED